MNHGTTANRANEMASETVDQTSTGYVARRMLLLIPLPCPSLGRALGLGAIPSIDLEVVVRD